jgi:hypothetical protein
MFSSLAWTRDPPVPVWRHEGQPALARFLRPAKGWFSTQLDIGQMAAHLL